jgi:hypothetical protein
VYGDGLKVGPRKVPVERGTLRCRGFGRRIAKGCAHGPAGQEGLSLTVITEALL